MNKDSHWQGALAPGAAAAAAAAAVGVPVAGGVDVMGREGDGIVLGQVFL